MGRPDENAPTVMHRSGVKMANSVIVATADPILRGVRNCLTLSASTLKKYSDSM